MRKGQDIWKKTENLKDDPLSFFFKTIRSTYYFKIGLRLFVLDFEICGTIGFCHMVAEQDWHSIQRGLPDFFILQLVFTSLIYDLMYPRYYATFQNILFDNCWDFGSAGDKTRNRILRHSKRLKIAFICAIIFSALCISIFMPYFEDEPEVYFFNYIVVKVIGKWSTVTYIFLPLTLYGFCFIPIRIVYVTTHLKYQLYLLKERLNRISDGCSVNKKGYQDIVYNRLSVCIAHHINIKRLAKILNEDVGIVTLSLAPISVAIFVSAVSFINKEIHPEENFRMYFILTVWFCQIFVIISQFQQLENESDKIFNTAYCCPWIEWDKRNRKALLMLLINSRRSITLSCFSMIDLNYVFILKLCKFTYSALTVFVRTV